MTLREGLPNNLITRYKLRGEGGGGGGGGGGGRVGGIYYEESYCRCCLARGVPQSEH